MPDKVAPNSLPYLTTSGRQESTKARGSRVPA